MVKSNYLALSWSVSRGRDTYGYNIARLDDRETDKRYKTCGGGYDMVGTVVGQWLQVTYQERLLALRDQAHARYSKAEGYKTSSNESGNGPDSSKIYGMCYHADENRVSLDGACGLFTMQGIAAAIGVRITGNYNRRKNCTEGFFVSDFGSNEAMRAAEKGE